MVSGSDNAAAVIAGRISTFALWAAAAVAIIGAAVLGGWVFQIEALISAYGAINMKTNTAIGFLLCAVSLLCLRRFRILGMAVAVVPTLIGLLTLSQHVMSWDLGIDQLLFREAPGAAATTSPNRMGPVASTSFILAGIALLLIHAGTERAVRIAQNLAFAGIALALLPTVGHAYGAEELFGVARYTGIALHTAIAFFLLHLGILSARPQYGPMAFFAAPGAAGMLLRRLVPWVVALPVLIGYLVIIGSEAGLFDRGLAHAMFAVSVIVILLGLMWHTSSVIEATDREREHAQQEADRANRLKDQFIAVMSHELRTPLNVMLGRLRVLENESSDDGTKARAAAIVVRNGRLLARLVEDLLDLSRASVGTFEISPSAVQFNALVRTVIDAVSPDATAKNVLVTSTLAPDVDIVHVDQERIQQVVFNLLTNAVKFTSSGGRVDVGTSLEPQGVVLAVRDTGIGFDDQFAEHLFEPFRQADPSSKREHGGLGLGLSIAKHLVGLHGGTITATSPGIGQGALFTLVLPHAVPEPSGDQTIAA